MRIKETLCKVKQFYELQKPYAKWARDKERDYGYVLASSLTVHRSFGHGWLKGPHEMFWCLKSQADTCFWKQTYCTVPAHDLWTFEFGLFCVYRRLMCGWQSQQEIVHIMCAWPVLLMALFPWQRKHISSKNPTLWLTVIHVSELAEISLVPYRISPNVYCTFLSLSVFSHPSRYVWEVFRNPSFNLILCGCQNSTDPSIQKLVHTNTMYSKLCKLQVFNSVHGPDVRWKSD